MLYKSALSSIASIETNIDLSYPHIEPRGVLRPGFEPATFLMRDSSSTAPLCRHTNLHLDKIYINEILPKCQFLKMILYLFHKEPETFPPIIKVNNPPRTEHLYSYVYHSTSSKTRWRRVLLFFSFGCLNIKLSLYETLIFMNNNNNKKMFLFLIFAKFGDQNIIIITKIKLYIHR